MRLFKCWTCNGEGGWQDYVDVWKLPYQKCPICDGTGKITFMEWFWEHAPVRLVEWVGDTFYNETNT
jgi:hypothetical protein